MTSDNIRYLSNEHYDVIVEACAVHPTTGHVLLLSIIGEPDAMKAIHATLALKLPFTMTGFPTCSWPRDSEQAFTKLHKRLPRGPHATLWLPQEGTSLGLQHDARAYIISRTPEETRCPPTFFSILDRVFACPIREDWTSHLWDEGLRRGWLTLMDCYNCTVWELQPRPEEVIEWIQGQLRAHALSVDAPFSASVPSRGSAVPSRS